MPDLVSILIPAYNAEQWIKETIQSALSQTWPKKEIIIVDDGSSDNTFQIAKEFESSSVKVVSQENRGASAARNNALFFAQGDYIQWLDADDLLAPDKISMQMIKRGEKENKRVLLSSAFGEFTFRHQKAKFTPHSLWHDLTPMEWIRLKISNNVWMIPATWLVSRQLTDLAGPWDERLSLDDDAEYFSRLVSVSEKVLFIPEAKSYYRLSNAGSLSRSISYKACESLLLSMTLCMGYLRSLEDSERTRDACLIYLQTWYSYFYPEKQELTGKMNDLAAELGGSLLPPKLGWKYSFIQRMFGWQTAKKVRYEARRTRFKAQVEWERLLSKLS